MEIETGIDPTELGIWSWLAYKRVKFPGVRIITSYRPYTWTDPI